MSPCTVFFVLFGTIFVLGNATGFVIPKSARSLKIKRNIDQGDEIPPQSSLEELDDDDGDDESPHIKVAAKIRTARKTTGLPLPKVKQEPIEVAAEAEPVVDDGEEKQESEENGDEEQSGEDDEEEIQAGEDDGEEKQGEPEQDEPDKVEPEPAAETYKTATKTTGDGGVLATALLKTLNIDKQNMNLDEDEKESLAEVMARIIVNKALKSIQNDTAGLPNSRETIRDLFDSIIADAMDLKLRLNDFLLAMGI